MFIKIFNKVLNKLFKEDIEKTKVLSGKNLLNNQSIKNSKNINDYEASIFSQWGEDGIINYLINVIEPKEKTFLEFGVDNYDESNTRFLLFNKNWSGHIIDGSQKNIDYIKKSYYYWKYDINAYCKFIDCENVNNFLKSKIKKKLSLLSLDIDGNDYWVLQELDLNYFNPEILICEYNSLLGNKYALTTPYEKKFIRNQKGYLYYGASILAFTKLCKKKGYFLVGSNLNGNNLFFLRNDLKNKFDEKNHEEVFQYSKFRESRDKNGNLTFENYEKSQNIISNYEFYNVDTEKNIIFKDLKI